MISYSSFLENLTIIYEKDKNFLFRFIQIFGIEVRLPTSNCLIRDFGALITSENKIKLGYISGFSKALYIRKRGSRSAVEILDKNIDQIKIYHLPKNLAELLRSREENE